MSSRSACSGLRSSSPPSAPAGGLLGDLADRLDRALRDALDELERDVAGEAVGDDDVGGAVQDLRALDVAGEVDERGALRALGERDVRLAHERRAAGVLLAVGEQPDARALDAVHDAARTPRP